MSYDFETLVPHIDDESSVMYKKLRKGGYPTDVIDYGVAEMKFPLLPELSDALVGLVKKGTLGYSAADDEYNEAVCNWMKTRHDYNIRPEYLVQTYGVVEAIGIAIRAFSNEGDNILIQSPVYNPFSNQIRSNGRNVIENDLLWTGSTYEINFADFEEKAKNAKMFILCSPHNPVGRVWSKEELSKMAEICLKYNVTVLSDEIHNDLVYGREHTVFATVSDEIADRCVVCTAPSKTFNIPGLVTSNTVIKNAVMREKFTKERDISVGHFTNPIGCLACKTAYTYGAKWVDELCAYLGENAQYLEDYLREKLPQAKMSHMEGTYLAWIDLAFLGMSPEELERFIKEGAGLPINMGYVYGDGGKTFVRVDIGCPKRYVTQFVDRLADAISKR